MNACTLILSLIIVLTNNRIHGLYEAQLEQIVREEFLRLLIEDRLSPPFLGYQPSCTKSPAVTQAVAKFSTKGKLATSAYTNIEYELKGVVSFHQINDNHIKIYGVFKGVQPFQADSPLFALHVHQKGELNPSCMATAAHYNPCNKSHSDDPRIRDRHVGDVANVTMQAGSDILIIEATDTQVKLSGPLSVLGRSIVVHAGAKGSRVGCAIIGVTDWPNGDRHPDTFYDPYNPTEFWKN